jgi:hypothetical protein
MAVFHTQPSEIDKLDWAPLVRMHEGALRFYREDRELLIKGIATAMGAQFGGQA